MFNDWLGWHINVPKSNPAIFTPAVASQHSYPHPGPPWVLIEFLQCHEMDHWDAHTTHRFMSRGKIKGTCSSAGKMLCSKFNGNPSVPITPYWSITHHHDRWQWWEWFPQAWMHERLPYCSQPLLFPAQGRSCSCLLHTRTCAASLSQNSVSLAWYNLNASSLSDHGEKGLAMTTRYNL